MSGIASVMDGLVAYHQAHFFVPCQMIKKYERKIIKKKYLVCYYYVIFQEKEKSVLKNIVNAWCLEFDFNYLNYTCFRCCITLVINLNKELK